MDVSIIADDVIKIRSKKAAFIVDPKGSEKIKTQADAVIFLSDVLDFDLLKVEGARVNIRGAGEYEISGVKISGFMQGGDVFYIMQVDGMEVYLGKLDFLRKPNENIKECSVAIVNVDNTFDASMLTALSPKVAILYGKGVPEKSATVQKFQITLEKMPQELEVVWLR